MYNNILVLNVCSFILHVQLYMYNCTCTIIVDLPLASYTCINANVQQSKQSCKISRVQLLYKYGYTCTMIVLMNRKSDILAYSPYFLSLSNLMLQKFNKKLNLSKVKFAKFNDSGQLVAFYAFSFIFAGNILWNVSSNYNIVMLITKRPHHIHCELNHIVLHLSSVIIRYTPFNICGNFNY